MSEHVTELQIDGQQVTIPTDATPSEAAAVAAALGAHMRDQQAAMADGDEEPDEQGWDGKRFAFAGRLEALGMGTRRVPQNVPTDSWTAAGRIDRY